MLSFSQVAIRRGGKQLFAGASFTIHAGERVGVVGGNGCGKSSLFQLILGTVECDEGQWSLAGQPEIAHVAQEIECDGRDGLEHVLDGDAEYRQLLERLEHHDTGVPDQAALAVEFLISKGRIKFFGGEIGAQWSTDLNRLDRPP